MNVANTLLFTKSPHLENFPRQNSVIPSELRPESVTPLPFQNNIPTFQANMVQGRPNVPIGLFLTPNHDLNTLNQQIAQSRSKVIFPNQDKTTKVKSKADYNLY